MLDEFRLAEGIAGRMTPEEVGRCYVRLKHAIDGGFRVVEATAERIVLVNDRCPSVAPSSLLRAAIPPKTLDVIRHSDGDCVAAAGNDASKRVECMKPLPPGLAKKLP